MYCFQTFPANFDFFLGFASDLGRRGNETEKPRRLRKIQKSIDKWHTFIWPENLIFWNFPQFSGFPWQFLCRIFQFSDGNFLEFASEFRFFWNFLPTRK